MSKINFPKKQEQRLIPKYLLEYAEELQENHPDPSAEWGGGSGGDTIQAGTGITITTESDDTKTISIDTSVVAEVSDIPTATSDLTNDSGYITSSDLPDYPTRPFLGVQQSEDPLYPEGSTFLFSKDGLHFAGKVRCLNGTEFFKCNLNALNDNYGTGLTVTGGNPTDGYAGRTISVNASEVVTAGNITTALGYTPCDGNYNTLSNKPDLSIYAESADLATVATTGDYDDLLDKPDLSVYAETSSLGDCAYLDENELSIDYSQITSTPIIPTLTSQLNNDSGFITSADLPTNYVTTDTNQTITGNKTFGKTNSRTDLTIENYSGTGYNKLKFNSNVGNISFYNDGNNFKTQVYEDSDHYYYIQYPRGLNFGYSDNTYTLPLSVNGTRANVYTGDISITIPTATSDLTNDSGFITGINSSDVTTALGFTPYSSANPDGYITGINSSDVITALGYTPGTSNFDGDYNSLTNKPTIPTATSDLTNDSGFITGITSGDVTTALGYTPTNPSSLATVATTGAYSDLSGTPTLATVATTGDYDDLTNTPTIPVVPTNVSAFTNDAGYITGIDSTMVTTALGYTPGTSNFSGNYNDLTNKPTIPNVEYANGDKFSYTSIATLNGFLTGAGKSIQFSFTTPKLMSNISSVTVDNLYLLFRGVAGYVGGSSYVDYANTTGYTVTAYIANANTITISIAATNAYSGGTNNTPIAIAINPTSNDGIKLTFNAS